MGTAGQLAQPHLAQQLLAPQLHQQAQHALLERPRDPVQHLANKSHHIANTQSACSEQTDTLLCTFCM